MGEAMFTICWSCKGGSGTSVVAAALAAVSALTTPTILVDLAGDQPALLGLTTPEQGISEWMSNKMQLEFGDLLMKCGRNLSVAARGGELLPDHNSGDWNYLSRALSQIHDQAINIVVDAGISSVSKTLWEVADTNYLIIRPCYLALRKAVEQNRSTTGVILITGGDRVLTRRDVQSVLKTEVVAEIALDPEIARRVDSGLLHSRIPPALSAALSPLLTHLVSI